MSATLQQDMTVAPKLASINVSNADDTVWGGNPLFDHNVFENLTNEEFLAQVLGPKNVGYPLLIPITFIYVVIFISGVIGNIAVCLVIVKNKSMHTATNYYLFSLAISDLMILVLGLPNDLAIYWQQYPWVLGEILCKGRSLISEMTSYSSVLTIVAFSMERYLAICHPLYSHTMSGFKRAVRIIALVWIISLVAAFPYALFTRVNYIDRPLYSGNFLPESAFCAMMDDNIYPKNYPVHELSSFIFFIFPMGILCILYIRMGFRIRQTSEIQRNLPRSSLITTRDEDRINGSRRSILRMLICRCCSAHEMGTGTRESSPGGCLCDHQRDPNDETADVGLCQICSEAPIASAVNTNDADTDSFTPRVRSDKRSVTILLAAVVLTFFICWAPFHAQRLAFVYFKDAPLFRTLNEYLYYLSGFLYYLSATVNPILYNLMSLKYRHAFRQTLCGGRRNVNRSYTFRSTTRTGIDTGLDYDAGRANRSGGFRRSLSMEVGRGRNGLSPGSAGNPNFPLPVDRRRKDGASNEDARSGKSRKAYPGRSEFRAAMRSSNVCSDIPEDSREDSCSNVRSPCSPCSCGQPRFPNGYSPLPFPPEESRSSLLASCGATAPPEMTDSACQTQPNEVEVERLLEADDDDDDADSGNGSVSEMAQGFNIEEEGKTLQKSPVAEFPPEEHVVIEAETKC